MSNKALHSQQSHVDLDVEKAQRPDELPPSDNLGTHALTVQEQPLTKLETNNGQKDPNIVTWEGPHDPQNPMNWPDSKKWLNIAILSSLSIITPLAASMFAPGVPRIMAEFNDPSSTAATFVVSIYVLGFAFGPLLVAPLSEVYGRTPLYNIGNLLFTLFTVGAALSNSVGMLMAFRFLMGLSGAVPVTIGAGSIADFMPVEKRGSAMAVWAMGPLLGPCIGPVAGGYLVQGAGWRWTYWLIVILGGISIPVAYFALEESYPPVLLERKAQRLRKETGNTNLRAELTQGTVADQFKAAIIRPMKLLLTAPPVTLLSLYVATAYGILYLLISTFAFVYAQTYRFNEGIIGLAFLPAGLGMVIGIGSYGALTDRMVRRKQALGIEHKPEARIVPALTIPCGIALPIGLFVYGWTTEKAVHWIVPMIGVVIFCGTLMAIMMSCQNYLVDSYLQYAASVIAASTVLRSLIGALLPMAGLSMYRTLGLGWGNSLLGFISLAMVPIPVAFYIFGERLRKK